MPVHALTQGETAGGEKYIEVQVRTPGAQTGTDAYGEPTYENAIRMYLADVPGPAGWPQSKIDTAVALFQAMLPQGLYIVNVSEDTGKAHLAYTITRDPNYTPPDPGWD